MGASFQNKNGQLFFGGSKGVTTFHPDSIYRNTTPPPILLTQLEISNRPAPIGPDQILTKTIHTIDTIRITHKESVISFRFVALNYTVPEKNKYAYKLEGLDNEWNSINDRRLITFTTLPPGTHQLKVKGSNSDGIWNPEAASLTTGNTGK